MSKPAFATRESKQSPVAILGGGMTGLAAGWASGLPVYEAEEAPGGICSSYYIRPGTQERLHQAPPDEEAYRFEIGGGHWIFGGDPAILRLIRKLAPAESTNGSPRFSFPIRTFMFPIRFRTTWGTSAKSFAPRRWWKS